MAIDTRLSMDEILIDPELRLSRFQGEFAFALPWYQDPKMVKMVDNKDTPYDLEQLERMYTYLNRVGELYFIEVKEGNVWRKAGDVTLCEDGDLPIVLIPEYQHCGIGSKVLGCLIQRAAALGRKSLEVRIYKFNLPSQGLFQKKGFQKTGETETEYIYSLQVENKECEEKDESTNCGG